MGQLDPQPDPDAAIARHMVATGCDQPGMKGMRFTFKDAINRFTEELPWLSVRDKETIMGRGLCKWLG